MTRRPLRTPRISEGLPFPLGATWDGLGVNFALFSAHATKVELCLFDGQASGRLARIELPEYTDEVWHGYLPDARPGTVYGYRVHGPYAPGAGHRFNPNKLLLDPYARAHVGELLARAGVFGYMVGDPGGDLTLRYARQRRLRAEMPGDRSRLHLGPRPPAARAVGRHDLLRDPRARLHQAPSGGARRPARHLRGLGDGGGRGLHRGSRRHLDRAAAGPQLRRRRPPGPDRASATTGATTRSASSRPTSAMRPASAVPRPSSRRWWRACTRPGSR